MSRVLILGMTALLLLIDDYNTYKNHGESLFSGLWKSLDDNGTLASLGKGFGDLKGSLGDIMTSLGDLGKALGKSGALSVGVMAINSTFEIFGATLRSIAGLITIIAGGIDGLSTHDWSMLKKGIAIFNSGVPQDIANNLAGTFGQPNGNASNPLPRDKDGFWPSHTSYQYPQASQPGVAQVTMSPVYHIYGASDPQSVARTVDRTNIGLITRATQGVFRA
ncbi:MAG: hypothetical protein P4L59_13460 [Desulfosporosinus sp.]|nr:hypothetical protein [Desulfosporosinus sp.]